MPYEQHIASLRAIFDNIKKLDTSSLRAEPLEGIAPWNGLDVPDFVVAFDDTVETVDAAFKSEALTRLPWNVINALTANMNAVHQHVNQFIASKNQQTFQGAFTQVESFRTNLQTFNIKYLTHHSTDFDEKIRLIDSEIATLARVNGEAEQAKDNINKLIEPAVAGSLSKSFSDRKGSLETKQVGWLVATVVVGVASAGATMWVVESLVDLADNKEVTKSTLR